MKKIQTTATELSHVRRGDTGRASHPWIIKCNHFPICGEAVKDQRIPVVHVGSEVPGEHQRKVAAGTSASIGKVDVCGSDNASWRLRICLCRCGIHDLPFFRGAATPDGVDSVKELAGDIPVAVGGH